MTDAEYIEKIDTVSTDQLFESLDYYGCDSYYADLWNATISELKKRVTPQSKWIPVSERLPEEKTKVLITNDKGKVDVIQWDTWWQNQTIYPNHIRAIAWQPLPEPYTKERREEE